MLAYIGATVPPKCPVNRASETRRSSRSRIACGRWRSRRKKALINTLLGKVFGTKNEREIKKLMPRVAEINALEPEIQKLTDEQLRAKTDEFRSRIAERTKHLSDEPMAPVADEQDEADVGRAKTLADDRRKLENEVLEEILPEAFAVVRESGRRVLNMRHFDVQLIGGMVLHSGKISEMKTGEGKTLVATLPV